MTTTSTSAESSTEPRRPVRWLLFALIYLPPLAVLPHMPIQAAPVLSLVPLFLWASLSDIRTRTIPDTACAAIGVIGILAQLVADPLRLPVDMTGALLLLVAGWGAGEVYYRWRSIDGFGLGDAKLVAACTLCVGVANIWAVLVLAALGGIVAALLAARRSSATLTEGIPFGPHLAYATYLVMILSAGT